MARVRPYTNACELLKGVGLRPTHQRVALAKLLFDGTDRHVRAEQLHGEALAAGVRVSLATVYNTLHQFTEVALLREVAVESGRTYFDTNISDHHHFFHEQTGELRDIPVGRLVIGPLPDPPAGQVLKRVDVIVRVIDRDG
ncbi:transcriptional repressor [Rhodospirillaceae bacterium AH-315-P19]|nr:transcriptional repressor [Rhodospirillaceae bacterium AH-315-P19]